MYAVKPDGTIMVGTIQEAVELSKQLLGFAPRQLLAAPLISTKLAPTEVATEAKELLHAAGFKHIRKSILRVYSYLLAHRGQPFRAADLKQLGAPKTLANQLRKFEKLNLCDRVGRGVFQVA